MLRCSPGFSAVRASARSIACCNRSGKPPKRPSDTDPAAARSERRIELLDDDVEQGGNLAAVPAEVLARKRPERDLGDSELRAPVEQIVDLGGTVPMSGRDVREARLAGPATVAVEDDREMVRHGGLPHLVAKPPRVRAVEGRQDECSGTPPDARQPGERRRVERRGLYALGHRPYETPASRNARCSRSISRAITSRWTWFVPS